MNPVQVKLIVLGQISHARLLSRRLAIFALEIVSIFPLVLFVHDPL